MNKIQITYEKQNLYNAFIKILVIRLFWNFMETIMIFGIHNWLQNVVFDNFNSVQKNLSKDA